LRRTIIIGGGSVARHEVARCIGSIPIRDAKGLAWDCNTSTYMQKRDKVILWICAGIGAIGTFSFLWAMYNAPQIDTYFSMLMLIISLIMVAMSFALLDNADKIKTK
jgi:hypothetical protein